MGSKVIGARIPDDLAKDFEEYCAGADKTSGEVLRKLIDDLIYPGSRGEAALASTETRNEVLATEEITELVNAQVKEQLGDLVDERLELAQVDRGLAEAERVKLASLESDLEGILAGFNKMVQTINGNNKDWGDKVCRLFLYLEAHTHWLPSGDKNATGSLIGPKSEEFNEEVELAKERLGALEAEAEGVAEVEGEAKKEQLFISGKTDEPGYKYFSSVNLSVKE